MSFPNTRDENGEYLWKVEPFHPQEVTSNQIAKILADHLDEHAKGEHAEGWHEAAAELRSLKR